MRLSKRILIQISIFSLVSLTAMLVLGFDYMRLPALFFGVSRYDVTLQLPEAAGLYDRSNVTYLGTEVGTVKDIRLTDSGVAATLSLRSDVKIPSDLDAQVHSQSAVGEQYVALLPRNASSRPLSNGDVIPRARTSVPPDINALLDATNRGLKAILQENLKTVVDESYTAFGGLGPEIARFLRGGSALAHDSRTHQDELQNLVDNVGPLLDTQSDTSDAVQAWASHLAYVTKSLQTNDSALRGVVHNTAGAADEARQLFERVQPTLPALLTNLVSVGEVAVAYRADLEQLLVLLPQGTQAVQGAGLANRGTKQEYNGAFLSFKLNLNPPPVCSTGFLPAQQQRSATFEDYPARPAGPLYCRVPQDAQFNVRGARNYPCETVLGKRAATVKLCESNEEYVPLNEGNNRKGDPNATLSGQGVPQFDPGEPVPPGYPQSAPQPAPPAPPQPPAGPPPAPLAIAEYNPTTGEYVGPDGMVYRQSDLANNQVGRTWQSMLVPPNE